MDTVIVHMTLDGFVFGSEFFLLEVQPDRPVEPLPSAVSVAAGNGFSLALLADGSVASWGDNQWTKLGRAEATGAVAVIPTLPRVTALTAARNSAIAMTETGDAWTWGSRTSDTGDWLGGSLPARVPDLPHVRAVAAGDEHWLALDAEGHVWAWGHSLLGALGNLDRLGSQTPRRVVGIPPAQAIAAGADRSFAVATDGSVWTWGRLVGAPHPTGTEPQQVAGLENIRAISTSGDAALALDRDGRLWTWGTNVHGRLGAGGENERVPFPVRLEVPADVVAFAMGETRSAAATRAGELWQWGQRTTDESPTLVPQRVAEVRDVVDVAVRTDHVLAVLRCGQVLAWGNNDSSQVSPLDIGFTRRGPGAWQSEKPTAVIGVGDDSSCPQVTVRIRAGGQAPFIAVLAGSPGPFTWERGEHSAVVDRGATLTVTAQPTLEWGDERYLFRRWANGCEGDNRTITVTADRSTVCSAVYDYEGGEWVLLRVAADGGHVFSPSPGISPWWLIDCGDNCAAVFTRNDIVRLWATPASGFTFTGWTSACSGASLETTVTMDDFKTCIAHFRAHTLDVSMSGRGRVISQPAGIDCSAACSTAPRAGSVTLIAIADDGWELRAWGGDCAGAATEITVSMSSDRRCMAEFVRTSGEFLLTVVADGHGTVASSPAGIGCPGTCSAAFAAGTRVTLTAQPATGWEVSFWLDDCAGPGSLTREVLIDADKTCRARITPQAAVPVARFSHGIPVHIGIHVGDVVTFNGLESHMFDPVTGTEDRSAIRTLAWDLDGDGVLNDAVGNRATAGTAQYAFQTVGSFPVRLRVEGGPFDLQDTAERTITVFPADEPLHELTVVKTGAGRGTVVTNPQGLIACGESCGVVGPILLEEPATITVIAQPAHGSTFVGWSGNGCSDTAATIQIAMTEARTCTARFAPSEFPLSVTTTAGGSVTSSPPLVQCGIDCSAMVPGGTSIVLTAVPDPGFEVDSWTGCDFVTGTQCTVAMVAPRAVGVTFVPASGPFTLTVALSGPAGSLGRVYSIAPPDAINCGLSFGTLCATTQTAGSVVVIRPDDWAIENNRFDGWSGCDSVGALFACTVTLTNHRTIAATFRP